MNEEEFLVDGFRFINQMHTTVRLLPVCSKLVNALGDKQLPEEFLKNIIFKWSFEQEQLSDEYRHANGKLTESFKGERRATTAFKHYLNFAKELGLLQKIGNIVNSNRLATVLNNYAAGPNKPMFGLNDKEKLFFLFILFHQDADALILAMSVLVEQDVPVLQKEILNNFKQAINERLTDKQKKCNPLILDLVREKYRVVNYEWENAVVYAEHILIPRLEWLHSLGLIKIDKQSNKTEYSLSVHGKQFYYSIPNLFDSKLKDIDEKWISKESLKSFVRLLFDEKDFTQWHNLSVEVRLIALKQVLLEAFKKFNTGGAMRLSTYPTILFIIIELTLTLNYITEFDDIVNELKNGVVIGNQKFLLRESARINESYISVNFI